MISGYGSISFIASGITFFALLILLYDNIIRGIPECFTQYRALLLYFVYRIVMEKFIYECYNVYVEKLTNSRLTEGGIWIEPKRLRS